MPGSRLFEKDVIEFMARWSKIRLSMGEGNIKVEFGVPSMYAIRNCIREFG
ncbi:MAG: hypothetical protein K8S27_13560 [Candidatus Omnitrophica bacterium]|nr:hypothetical protein [Candidatus Omnitrophota bacterium]